MTVLAFQLVPRVFAMLAEPDRRGAVLRAWWLWVGLFLLGVLLVLVVAAIGRRRRALSGAARGQRPARPIKDAWVEAGKRAEPLAQGEITPGDDE